MTLKNAKGTKLNITRAAAFEERWFTEDDSNFSTSNLTSLLNTDNLISNDNDYDLSNLNSLLDSYPLNLIEGRIETRIKERGTSK